MMQRSMRVGLAAELPAHARLGGQVRAGRKIHLTIELASRDPRGLAAFVQAVSTPGSPEYRDYLTVKGFARRFGAEPAALRISAGAFRHAGFRVGAPAANGLSLSAVGSAAQIDHALRAQISAVRLASGATGFVNRSAPVVPAAAAPYVLGVSGLDDLDVVTHAATPARSAAARRPGPLAGPAAVTGGPQPCPAATETAVDTFAGSSGTLAYRSGYTADLLATVYGFSPLYGASDEGAGQTVALEEEVPYQASDVQTFQQCYGTEASVQNVDVGGGVGTTSSSDTAALGIETITSLAPKANVLVYQGTDQLAVLARMVSDDAAKVIATSVRVCEAAGAGGAASYETLLEEAAAQGQSVFAASGDNGSSCESALATQLPASSPLVTAVGGTTLYASGAGGAEPYASGRTPLEAVWNNGVVSSSPTGTGGGLSSLFAMPSYQSGAAPGLDVIGPESGGTCGALDCREVPDVSADADGGSGYVVFAHGAWKVLGGTGFAAPLWAAFAALTNASAACRGASIGFANPSLYQLAGGSSAGSLFNDVVNSSPRTAAANNDAAGTNGGHYAVRAGYDMATGLGSMHGAALANALCQVRAPLYTVTIANPGAQATPAGTPVGLQLHGSDSGSLPLSYTATGLPPGLTMSSSGTVTGSPTTPGTYTVTANAADVATNRAGIQFPWTITSETLVRSGKPTVQKARLTGSAAGHPRLSFVIKAGSGAAAVRRLTLLLPPQLKLTTKTKKLKAGVTVKSAGRREKVTLKRKGRQLQLTLSPAATSAIVTITGPAITVEHRFRTEVRRHRIKSLRVTLTVIDSVSTRSLLLVTFKL
jgi:subtilase family serine protease